MTKDELKQLKDEWLRDLAKFLDRPEQWVKDELQARFGTFNESNVGAMKNYLINVVAHEEEEAEKEAEETRPLVLPPLEEGWPEICPQHGVPTYTHWVHRGGWRRKIWGCKTGGTGCYYKNKLLKHSDETQIALAYLYSDWCVENGIEQKTATGFSEWKVKYGTENTNQTREESREGG